MALRILVFGNPLAKIDSAAVKIAERLEGSMPHVEFVRFDTSEDLENEGPCPVILDAVVSLQKPRLVLLSELEKSANPLSLHGFDLIWSLLLLKKIGKIKSAKIIGVPARQPYAKSLPPVKRLIEKIQAE
jgi:Ni,Fe-hydrogenase maturation factor